MAAPSREDPRRQLAVVVLAVFFVVVQFPVVLATFTPKAESVFDFQVLAFPSDLLLAVLIVFTAPDIVRRARQRTLGLGTSVLFALVVVMLAAFAAHPSSRGVQTLFRLTGTAVIAALVADLRAGVELGLATGGFAAWAVVQSVLAAVQRIKGRAIGLHRLNESTFPFVHFGPALAPQGTMVHPYLLAGLALLAGGVFASVMEADRHPAWLVVAGVAAAPVGFTYSRAGLLGYVAMVGCVGLAAVLHGGRRWLALFALVIGVAIPAAVWSNGWTQRAQQTTKGSSINEIDTDRSVLIREALHLIRRHPILGVGPGRYVIELRDRHMQKVAGVYKPVHDVPLLVAAEGGLLAGVLVVALLLALAWQARRAGLMGAAILVSILPFVLLDHFAYSFPQGLAMTGVWVGALDLLGGARAPLGRLSRPASAPA